METYYVSQAEHAKDDNPGTSSLPRRTITAGCALLLEGDTLMIRPGTYHERLNNVIPSGRSDAPTTVRAETFRSPFALDVLIVSPADEGRLRPVIAITDREWIRLQGLVIDSTLNRNTIIYFVRSFNCAVEYCEIRNMVAVDSALGGAAGFDVGPESGACHLRHSWVHHIGMLGSPVANPIDHGLYIAGADCIIEHNLIEDNIGHGIHCYNNAGTTFASNCKILNNIIRRHGSRGILLGAAGSNNICHNNTICGNWMGIQSGGFGPSSSQNKIYNNLICGNNIGPGGGEAIIIFGTDNYVRNNILFQNKINTVVNQGSKTALENNVPDVDPLFVGADDFHLQDTSPARGFGVAVPEVAVDFDHVVRPARPSVGAFEWVHRERRPVILPGLTCDETLAWVRVTSGAFEPMDATLKTVSFPAREGRYICLRSLTSFHGETRRPDGPWASAADIGVLVNGSPLSKELWSIHCVSSEELGEAQNAATNAIDNNHATFWHSEYAQVCPGHPHNIVIDLGQPVTMEGFTYLPRQTGVNGIIVEYEFYVGSKAV